MRDTMVCIQIDIQACGCGLGRNWNPNCQTYVEAGWIFGDYHLIICGFGCNHTQ